MAASGLASARAGRAPSLAKYEVLEEIGHGGMATVYRAHDARLARDVAIKVIHPHLRDSTEARHRFHTEARAVAKLRHANIVEVFDVSLEEENEQYLVVELVRGATLRKTLQGVPGGAIPPEVAAALALEILAALAHAHAAGVVHRDVKPENVMIEHRAKDAAPHAGPGDRAIVKLTDFGIAKLLDAQGVTSTGQVLGSPAHMAPEQIEGGDVDARADVFGLGVLLYECMVGHLPFEGNNPAQVLRRVLEGIYPNAERERPKIGKRWSAILDKALARSPADRFASAVAMRDAIAAELETVGVASPRAELEAWLDDPEGYARAHDQPMIAKLCALGREARAKGDALGAAAHFNRALAYAPHDPQLLKIVSSMHRAQSWRRIAMRVAPIVVVSGVLGVAAYAGGRAFKARQRAGLDPVASATSAPSSTVRPGPTASAPSEPSAIVAPRPAPPPPPPRPAVVKPPVQRKVTITSLRPQFDVAVAIDDAPPVDVTRGSAFTLDAKPHVFLFSCKHQECESATRAVAAGEEPEVPLVVELALKPAHLVVNGDPTHVYGLKELPDLTITAQVPASIPLAKGNVRVRVVDRNTEEERKVWLNPAKTTQVDFTAPAPEPP
jgi:serine/threonine-protein kinase